jgi:hypothetical protein
LAFRRQLKLWSKGRECIAVKRALARAGFGSLRTPGTWTPVWGPFAVQNCKNFQKKHGIPATGVYGPATHEKLLKWFDAYSIKLYPPVKTPAQIMREKIVAAARYFASIEPRVHYTESAARMTIVRAHLHPPIYGDIWEDCSSFATGCYYIAGAPNPNGYPDYNPADTMYTGTLGEHGRVVSLSEAQPGDLVLYGWGHPWKHVAIYIGKGLVISHGREAGPVDVPIDYRSDRGEIRSYL